MVSRSSSTYWLHSVTRLAVFFLAKASRTPLHLHENSYLRWSVEIDVLRNLCDQIRGVWRSCLVDVEAPMRNSARYNVKSEPYLIGRLSIK